MICFFGVGLEWFCILGLEWFRLNVWYSLLFMVLSCVVDLCGLLLRCDWFLGLVCLLVFEL